MTQESILQKIITFSQTGVSLVAVQLAVILPNIICAYYIGQYQDPIPMGAYGLALTFINVTFLSIILGMVENMGVHNSKYFGAQKYDKMVNYMGKTLLIAFLWFIIFIFLAFHSRNILLFFEIEKEVAIPTSNLLRHCIPYLLFSMLNQLIENYLSSQHISKPLNLVNISSLIFVTIFGQIFFVHLKMGELGFAYTKLVQESINFCWFLIILKKYAKSETMHLPQLKNVLDKYLKFIKRCCLATSSFYGEIIAFEINTYFAALIKDIHQLAVWVTLSNISMVFFFSSIGLSFTMRNLVGKKVGQKKYQEARSDSIIYLLFLIGLSIILGVLMILLKRPLSTIFATNELVVHYLQNSIVIYGIITVVPIIILYAINSLQRLNGQDQNLVLMNIIVFPIVSLILSYILTFSLGLEVYGLTWSQGLAKIFILFFLIKNLYWELDWDKVRRKLNSQQSLPDTDIELKEKFVNQLQILIQLFNYFIICIHHIFKYLLIFFQYIF